MATVPEPPDAVETQVGAPSPQSAWRRVRWRIGRTWRPPEIGGVARNFAVVGAATATGQVALMLAAPFVARLYDPASFGILAIYTAIVSVLLVVGSMRFDFAIPISTERAEAVNLVALSIVLALLVSTATALIVVIFGADVASALGAAALVPWLWVLPVTVFAACVIQALSAWGVYLRQFAALGRMRAIQGIGQAICQLLLGLLHAGPGGLIAADMAGRSLGTSALFRSYVQSIRSTEVSIPSLRLYVGRHWAFARVMMVASLLGALSLQVPFLLIPPLFDLESSGQFFLAYRVLVLPASLVSGAMSSVFLGEASFRQGDRQRLHDLALNATVSLLVFAIPTYAIVAVGGANLIQAVFGEQWTDAGTYAQLLAPWLMVWTAAGPISSLLLVGRRQLESLVFTAVGLIVAAGSLLIGARLGSLAAGIALLSLVSTLIGIASVWRFLRVASVGMGELAQPTLRIAVLTVPSLVLVLAVAQAAPNAVVPACAVAWAIAFVLALRSSPEPRALLSGSRD